MFKHTLYAVRHGQTGWNAQERFQGRTDVPLAPIGRQQVEANAVRLSDHLRSRPASDQPLRLFTSPLSRCAETGAIMATRLPIPPEARACDERLAEAGFGRWEGLTTYEVKERFPHERRLRKADRWNFAPAGGGSYADLSRSMQSFLDDAGQGPPMLIVSHSGNLRVMFGMLKGLDAEETMRLSIPHDRVFVWERGCLLLI